MKKNKKKNPSTKLRVKTAAKKRPVAKKKIVAKKKRPVAKKKSVVKKKKTVARKKVSRKIKAIMDISKEKFDYFMAKIAAI